MRLPITPIATGLHPRDMLLSGNTAMLLADLDSQLR